MNISMQTIKQKKINKNKLTEVIKIKIKKNI